MNRFSAMSLVGLGACAAVGGFAIWQYGGESLWPELVASFAGTLVAFMLALEWERDRERRRALEDAQTIAGQRATEIRRRLEPIRTELEKNAESLEAVVAHLQPNPTIFTVSNPQLLDGAWQANASRLSELVADFKLITDLGLAYGRIEELRWRLRTRTERTEGSLDQMILKLVEELRGEVADLLQRVDRQIKGPTVQTIGVAVELNLAGSITPQGGLTLKKIPGEKSDGPENGPEAT